MYSFTFTQFYHRDHVRVYREPLQSQKHTNNLTSLLSCYYQCPQNSNEKLTPETIAASDKGEQKLDKKSLLSL